jgi:hypothetical protein
MSFSAVPFVGFQRNLGWARHHRKRDATVLKTRNPKNEDPGRRMDQLGVPADHRAAITTKHVLFNLLVVAIAATATATSTATATATADDTPSFKITTKRESDTLEVRFDNEVATFILKSPIGIGNAVIEQKGEKWPEVVFLRLRLMGLEHFQFTNDKVKLEASVSSQNGTVRLWKDDKEDLQLDAKSSLWMEIRKVGDDGKPTTAIPLKGGYFEMQLPKMFFEGNPKSIALHWIDFYRN